jgi:tetratricopeptide (TPR) repeat protein
LLYAATFQFGFVLDDTLAFSENNFVRAGLAGLGDIFTTEHFTGYLRQQQDLVAGARYRPLSLATFALEHAAYGLKPGISHFWNVVLYGLTGLLIFRLFYLFQPGQQPWYRAFPFLLALLFLLHPIHTEVVANIKGRDEILVLLLSLATLFFSWRYAVKGSWVNLLASGTLFWLALLAKENAITFLAVIPLTLFLFSKASWSRIGWALVPLVLALGLYLAMRIHAIGYLIKTDLVVSGIMNDPFLGLGWQEKYATIASTLGKYVQLLVFPHPLTHDYYPYQIPVIGWGHWRAWGSLLLYLGLFTLAVRSFRKGSMVSWSILYYLLTLSIVSNIVISLGAPMNERFVYVSSLGACALLVYFFTEGIPALQASSPRWRTAGLALLGLMALGFAFKTVTRVPAWENAMTLNRAAIAVSTNSARANSYMAYSLYQRGLQEQGAQQMATFQEALPYVNRALEIYPAYKDAITCKGGIIAGIYQQTGDLPALLDGFYELLSANHVSFIDQYLEYLNGRVDQQQLADFYHRSGYELMALQQQQYPLAIQYLNYGLQVSPGNLTLLEDLAETHYLSGNTQQARQITRQILQQVPTATRSQQLLNRLPQ